MPQRDGLLLIPTWRAAMKSPKSASRCLSVCWQSQRASHRCTSRAHLFLEQVYMAMDMNVAEAFGRGLNSKQVHKSSHRLHLASSNPPDLMLTSNSYVRRCPDEPLIPTKTELIGCQEDFCEDVQLSILRFPPASAFPLPCVLCTS